MTKNMTKPFCGAHKIMETSILLIQATFLANELLVLYLIPTNFWIVNVYIDTGVFTIGHILNFVYYKTKCREHTLTVQTLIEGTNLIVSLSLIFLLFQLAPNISLFLYEQQYNNARVLSLILAEFLVMNAIGNQCLSIVRGVISMGSRCFINYNRKKNNKIQPDIRLYQTTPVSGLLDDLANEIESSRELLSQTIIEPQ